LSTTAIAISVHLTPTNNNEVSKIMPLLSFGDKARYMANH